MFNTMGVLVNKIYVCVFVNGREKIDNKNSG